MHVLELNGPEFHDLACQILRSGRRLRFLASGNSMQPFILNHDVLEVAPLAGNRIHIGDVLLVETNYARMLAHRVVKTDRGVRISNYLLHGDNCTSPDGWFRNENILGRVEVVERGNQRIRLTSFPQRWRAQFWVTIAPLSVKCSWIPYWIRKLLRNWLLVC